MSERLPYVITISRLLGSGGSYLGQRVSARLGISYADREIVRDAAEMFHLSEEVGETLDERMIPLWQSLLRTFQFGSLDTGYTPAPNPLPTDREFHEAEAQIVKSIAQAESAVIVGRGGFHAGSAPQTWYGPVTSVAVHERWRVIVGQGQIDKIPLSGPFPYPIAALDGLTDLPADEDAESEVYHPSVGIKH